MLDRSTPPIIQSISSIAFPKIEEIHLKNKLPVHLLRDDSQEVLRIDFMFTGGIWQQPQPLVAGMTNDMLREGTRSFSSQEIAEKLDFYGSWLSLSCSYHYSYITIYSLCKYLPQTLSVLESMIKESVFPEAEFDLLRNKRKQRYLLDKQKVQILAADHFAKCVYGENHPYAKTAKDEDFESITTELLKQFYKSYYHSGNCRIIISGKIDDSTISQLDKLFGSNDWGNRMPAKDFTFSLEPSVEKHHFIPKEDTVQSAIKIGCPSINRKHPDFFGLKVANTILGGYFGSRLMSSIREEKGYTYGISSALSSIRDTGIFSISTQTANEFVEPLIEEVYAQIAELCHKKVHREELNIVKNCMMGDLTRAFDGIFSVTDAYISLLANDSSFDFYKKQIDTIRHISAKEIQLLAEKYLGHKEFYEIVVGKNSIMN
jgi:predicted Zn-dependent peptidase